MFEGYVFRGYIHFTNIGFVGGQGYIQGGSYGFVKKPEVTSEISTIPSVQTMMLVSQIAI